VAAVRALTEFSSREENLTLLDTEDGCWECGAFVPIPQRRHSLATLEAIICGSCEPWVRATLHIHPEEA
jgi:hypothetical protein